MSTSQLQPDAHGTRSSDLPIHRRFFIGPMPEKVISQTEAQVRKKKKRGWFNRSTQLPEGGDDQDNLSNIIQENAFQFFLREGGNEEDWGDNTAKGIREEMFRRWGDSEWGNVWKRRQRENRVPTSRWVGGSFEIGQFLGVNILDQETTGSSRHSAFSKPPSSSIRPTLSVISGPSTSQAGAVSTAAAENSFVTAPSKFKSSTVAQAVPLSPSTPGSSSLLQPVNGYDAASPSPASNSSTTALLPVAPHPAPVPRKSKLVHYADHPIAEVSSPAPPTEVLARTGRAVEDTSAGATDDVAAQDEMTWGEVVMRGMLALHLSG